MSGPRGETLVNLRVDPALLLKLLFTWKCPVTHPPQRVAIQTILYLRTLQPKQSKRRFMNNILRTPWCNAVQGEPHEARR